MKYFLDTEFLEGTQKKWFGQTKPTIDLISIGIVCEDGREYYAISKDFNLKEAWNRYDIKVEQVSGDMRNRYPEGIKSKVYWIRKNVLLPIHNELVQRWALEEEKANQVSCTTGYNPPIKFSYKNIKKLIDKYGKSNEQIAAEIKDFISYKEIYGVKDYLIVEGTTHEFRRLYENRMDILKHKNQLPEFYAYYADYDWVVFCWLFGKMIDLPKGLPMYCNDIKQEMDRIEKEYNYKGSDIIFDCKKLPNYPKQTNEHNALADARWNYELYKFLQSL